MLSKVSDETITVNTPKSVESLLAKYSFVSDVYNASKQGEKATPYTATYGVRELPRTMTANEIENALATQGLRSATAHELLCFADVYPEACNPALVAIGSGEHLRGHMGVPVVTIKPGGDSRADEMFVERLSAGTHVLAVKIEQTSR